MELKDLIVTEVKSGGDTVLTLKKPIPSKESALELLMEEIPDSPTKEEEINKDSLRVGSKRNSKTKRFSVSTQTKVSLINIETGEVLGDATKRKHLIKILTRIISNGKIVHVKIKRETCLKPQLASSASLRKIQKNKDQLTPRDIANLLQEERSEFSIPNQMTISPSQDTSSLLALLENPESSSLLNLIES